MPQYLTPGVYVEEIERGPRPIEGVPTSTAAFLGETERGPLRPHLVTSYKDYVRWFGGGLDNGRFMLQAVDGFFQNGGRQLYVCRIVGAAVATAAKVLGDVSAKAVGPGVWGKNVWVKIEPGSTQNAKGEPTGFKLKLAYWSARPDKVFDPFADTSAQPRPQTQEIYDDLSVDPRSSEFYEKRLTDSSTNLPVSALATILPIKPGPVQLPKPSEGFLDGGKDDPNITSADFVGNKPVAPPPPAPPQAALRDELQGLQQLTLDPFRDVALVYAPSPPDNKKTVNAIITHCETQRFRFAVIDPPDTEPSNLDARQLLEADTQYAAFYTPWIYTSDPESGALRKVPPGGHVLGVYARSDSERGVFKAPANEIVRGALDLSFDINDITQGVLNPRGVNAIRRFPGRGIRVWGARTLSSNGLWKYVPVRRLFIFLERSIYEGTQWVVFEPNDYRLWARVKDTIRLFLRTQWREGALFGKTEEEAFFITCDRTTMTQDDILNGRLICEIGIAPVRPAEFVIFRIFQNTAEAQR